MSGTHVIVRCIIIAGVGSYAQISFNIIVRVDVRYTVDWSSS